MEVRPMAEEVQYDLCPETSIGCVMVNKEDGLFKIDLMPDEASDLRTLVNSGDLDGAKALLVSVDARAAEAMDSAALNALVKKIR
jgi:hypothetical protein